MNLLMDRGRCNLCQKLLIYLTNYGCKSNLTVMSTWTIVLLLGLLMLYRRHLKIIVSSVHKPLNTIITSSNPNSYISESLFKRLSVNVLAQGCMSHITYKFDWKLQCWHRLMDSRLEPWLTMWFEDWEYIV